ncbi:hypothetical protein QNH39_26420 [Neobacillus novalis]|uniref:Essential protein Yae1 N-terminal domain-containing protein n=1 Tax=Neobacillus novalis TaxID=220687 RepID=A0AA95SGG9_9BACI|nr:hypothetical protein [Neobacillus novalis]WHY86066.1 hypothetical protein QNH39_26420 [Neobacillus novalis]
MDQNQEDFNEYIKGVERVGYLKGFKKGYNEGLSNGYHQGVVDTVNQIKREAHELFKSGKNYGMNTIKHLKSKYPHI